MKKLLILVLVLGMTSMAGAALQISVNGDLEPVDSEIILDAPSGEVTLDIWTDSLISTTDFESWKLVWAMVVQTDLGSISGGITLEPYASDGGWAIYDDATGNSQVPEAGANGVWGGITPLATDAQPGSVMFDEILFHCEGEGDAYINIYSLAADGVTWTLEDTVIIHQVPEPATIALLGLGGLLLRRRK